jgi:acetyl-CoA acetyltransferase
MPQTAERVAQQWHLTREELDAFALRSHERAVDAVKNGRFADEIVPVPVAGGAFAVDEGPRADTSLEVLGRLKPVNHADGLITAGNSSSLNDGAAAVVVASTEYARKLGLERPVRIDAVSTVTPTFPQTVLDMPGIATDPKQDGEPERTFKESIAHAAYEEAGIAPEDVGLAEVYDLSTALELDWMEDVGLCKRCEAEVLLRAGETSVGGRIPVNPSGGLACFGEAVPAQAIAQVCELTWQLKGQATGRQVEGAKVGITANQGLFGHGSSVLLST